MNNVFMIEVRLVVGNSFCFSMLFCFAKGNLPKRDFVANSNRWKIYTNGPGRDPLNGGKNCDDVSNNDDVCDRPRRVWCVRVSRSFFLCAFHGAFSHGIRNFMTLNVDHCDRNGHTPSKIFHYYAMISSLAKVMGLQSPFFLAPKITCPPQRCMDFSISQ